MKLMFFPYSDIYLSQGGYVFSCDHLSVFVITQTQMNVSFIKVFRWEGPD